MSAASKQPTAGTLNNGIAILTAGKDRPYALGLAASLISLQVPFDFIGSDYLDSPELRQSPLVKFINLRGDQSLQASMLVKVRRVLAYYMRLIAYAATSRRKVFHILWNNKFEVFDRTVLMVYYKILGKRLVFTAHNVNKNKRDNNDSGWNRLTLGIQYRLLDHIFVHTEQMRQELLVDFNVPTSKISVIPFGINSTVQDTRLTSQKAREKLGLLPTDKTLLFFGNIAPYKGLEYLIEALVLLAKESPHYRLIVAGLPKGVESYWESIRQRIVESGVENQIIQRIEYVPDEETEIYFKAADVFILPYTHIFQSGVLFLGYNFGLPVIASDVGSLRDDIQEGETGYVCKPKDPADLATSIERYFQGPLYLDQKIHREKIRHYAKERYSWTRVGMISIQIYVDVLN